MLGLKYLEKDLVNVLGLDIFSSLVFHLVPDCGVYLYGRSEKECSM